MAIAAPVIGAEWAGPRWKAASTEADREGPAKPAKSLHAGRAHLLLEFEQPPTPQQLRALAGRGLHIVAAAPDTGVVVAASVVNTPQVSGVRRSSFIPPTHKLSPMLGQRRDEAQRFDFLVEFHGDTASWEARTIALREHLLIRDHPDLDAAHLLVEGTAAMARSLTEWDEVAYVFPASSRLSTGQRTFSCAGALLAAGPVGQYIAAVGPGWDGPGLGAATLTYSYEDLSKLAFPEEIESEINRAIEEWSRVVQIRFLPGTDVNAPRNLNILFARGDYGSGFAFDGVGGRLAQAFYPAPPNPEPIAGDVHFDDSEDWHTGTEVDLFSIALHEIGHALGLGHSDDPNSVMYPYYHPVTGLTRQDRASIRKIYAPRRTRDSLSRLTGPARGR